MLEKTEKLTYYVRTCLLWLEDHTCEKKKETCDLQPLRDVVEETKFRSDRDLVDNYLSLVSLRIRI